MKPPGSSARRQPLSGRSLPEAASCLRLRPPSRLHLLLGLLLLSGPAWPRPWGAAAATALHWNETAGGIAGALADKENTFLQINSSRSKNNNESNEIQKEITLPSRLVYYINRDSESPYHILDTRARHQQKHNKAVHLAQASFQIEAFGSKFILDLTLNNCMCFKDHKIFSFPEASED